MICLIFKTKIKTQEVLSTIGILHYLDKIMVVGELNLKRQLITSLISDLE